MRIAHVITRLILGGAQENTVLCCRDLIEQHGDEVLLISGPAIGPEGSLFGAADGMGIPSVTVSRLRREICPLRDFDAYRQIKKILREFSPDVVHTHSAKAGVLGRYAAWSLGIPAIVHTVHGAPFHQYQSRFARAFIRSCERRAAARCHRLVSVADAMTGLMVRANVAPREKFVTVYSGMDVDMFLGADERRSVVRAELGYRDDHVVVGKLARLFHLKGHQDVIQAARKVVDRVPSVRFLFVGDGVLQRQLRDHISSVGLDEYFQFTGLVPPAKVAGLLSAMDLVVHTSLREGLARALPQSLIVGRPVISYDIDGASEVVIDGVTGRLIVPRDITGLSDALVQLSSDESLRKIMGTEGQRRFQDQFRHELMTSQLRKIYSQLLA